MEVIDLVWCCFTPCASCPFSRRAFVFSFDLPQLYKLALSATGQAQVSVANFQPFIVEIKAKLKEVFFDVKKIRREDTGTYIYGSLPCHTPLYMRFLCVLVCKSLS